MDAKEDIRTLKVAELRERLQELGMSSKGKKEILVARLAEALQSEVEVVCPSLKRFIVCIDRDSVEHYVAE